MKLGKICEIKNIMQIIVIIVGHVENKFITQLNKLIIFNPLFYRGVAVTVIHIVRNGPIKIQQSSI